MSTKPAAATHRLEQTINTWVDTRIGNALFIGAALPELAAELVSRGIPVMLVESDIKRVEAFMASCRELGVDKRVSMDSRPYPDIAFEAMSYNLILAWNGIPLGMPPELFFKKTKRELKAGSSLFLRQRVLPQLPPRLETLRRRTLARLPKAAGELCERLRGYAPSLTELKAASGTQLRLERMDSALPAPGKVLERVTKVPGLASLTSAIEQLSGGELQDLVAGDVLLELSKTLDMGRVFLTGSRFDPNFLN